MNCVKGALAAVVIACSASIAWAQPSASPDTLSAAEAGVDCARPNGRADVALCAQVDLAKAMQASLVWRRWEVFLLIAALGFSAWAARSAARAVEAAKKDQSSGDRPFAFLIVHGLQYEPVVGETSLRATLEGRQFRLSYVIKNYGRSACIVRRVAVSFAQAASLARATDKIEVVAHPSWVIPQNGEESGQVARQASWSVEGLDAYRDGRETLFVSGEVHYEDLGGAQYVRRFCLTKGYEKAAAEEGGAGANYDRRVYQNPRWTVSAAPPPPQPWPPEGLPPPPADKGGARVIPMKK